MPVAQKVVRPGVGQAPGPGERVQVPIAMEWEVVMQEVHKRYGFIIQQHVQENAELFAALQTQNRRVAELEAQTKALKAALDNGSKPAAEPAE